MNISIDDSMIEDKIEIQIPTYNRANYLDDTLKYLLNSPFKNCKITIRDNASTDKTPNVCKKYSKLFKNLHIIRNNKNIGGNANIFNCYAQATYPYIWVLADNDYLNFDKCDDFIEAIETEKYDLIICTSGTYTREDSPNFYPTVDDEPISEYIKQQKGENSKYLENTTQELALIIKKHYFKIGVLISSTIYKTSLIDTDILISASNNISRSYPHFPLIAKALNDNLSTYKTKEDVIFYRENPKDSEVDGIELTARYLESILLIENKEIRSIAEEESGHKLYFILPAAIIYTKAKHDPNLKTHVLSLIKTTYLLKGWGKGILYQIYLMIFYCIPNNICEYYVKKRTGK